MRPNIHLCVQLTGLCQTVPLKILTCDAGPCQSNIKDNPSGIGPTVAMWDGE